MKLEELENANRLFETYGFALSSQQSEVLELHLAFGLQAAEIAENKGISKQAVSKILKTALAKLGKMENNLRFLAFQDKIKQEIIDLSILAKQKNLAQIETNLQNILKEL